MKTFENATANIDGRSVDEGLRAHMSRVYATMSFGMLVTFATALIISVLAVSDIPGPSQIGADRYLTSLGEALYLSPLKWVVMFAPLALVLIIGGAMKSLTAGTAKVLFNIFAAVMGLSISSIFLIFTGQSIVQIFLITAIAFAGLSLWGYTTRKDISAWGNFLIMGVIGLIAAAIVNIFIGSSSLSFAISAIAVLVFAALTAHDTQRIKTDYIAQARMADADWMTKVVIMAALSLFLNFINMFIGMLSLFGNRE